ncbi:hypothetical protein [Sulfitobacter sp. W074]|jgi:hypothetical protein|uniref:hypothetical protein n=1 Tax=Sulfitobacter sp. W074 TaxID=2867026 RepID=UPI0021A52136|nr:hypothetical protein [Sulfitobacter sp. W074]UWR36887.1 hypothetical protein K3762_14060 [Sulfitobacter sp. W074]
MSQKQEQTSNGAGNGSDAQTRVRVVADLKAASETIENSAFDLAGDASPDVVSDLIRITADLQMLIAQLSQPGGR